MNVNGDTVTNEGRDRLLGDASGFLVTIGYAMMLKSNRDASRSAQAVATCVQVTGDLATGIRRLIGDRSYYSAAGLGRQVLESVQLIQYLAANPDRAEFWLTATDNQISRASDFRPGRLRAATASNDRTYSRHCFLGGHPRYIARMLLPGSPWRRPDEIIDLSSAGFDIQTDLQALLLADSLQHLYDAVLVTIDYLDVEAFHELGSLKDRSVNLTDELVKSLVEWKRTDPLAKVGPNEGG